MPKLTQSEIDSALPTLNGWRQSGAELQQQFQFADFKQAMAFVNRVAALAEAADHHPDIHIHYNKVILVLSTHSEGGITQKDVNLARQIEEQVQDTEN